MKKVQHKSNLPHPDGQRQWWCVAGTSQPKAPAQESVSQETLSFTMGCLSHFECFSGRLCFTWGSVSSDESFTCRKRKARPEQSSALHSISALNSGFPFWDFLPPWWVKNPRYWLCLVSNLPVLVSSLPWSWKQACYCSPQDLPQPSQSSRKPPYSLKKTQVFLLLCFHLGRRDHCSKAAPFWSATAGNEFCREPREDDCSSNHGGKLYRDDFFHSFDLYFSIQGFQGKSST